MGTTSRRWRELYAIDQTRSWEQRRVDGVGRPKFDSTQVGAEGENLYFYRMPGSGLSIYTGHVLVLNKNAPKNTQVSNKSFYKTENEFRGPGEPMRKRFERVKSEGYDTVHAPQSKGLGQEILALRHAGQSLGRRGQRINGNMLVKAGHMRCGQPPDVRVCAPDEPAALLHEACPPWNSHRPGERLTEKNREHILKEVEGHGIHSCWKGGDDSVMENPMVYFCVEIKFQAPDAVDAMFSTQAQVGRKLRDAVSVLFAGYSTRGRLLALAAVASALQPQVRAALNHWEPELVDIAATTAGVTRRP